MKPKHIAIVIDGNRRWAKKQGLKAVWNGHEKGAKKVEELLEWAKELDIKELTIYCLSVENLKRDEKEKIFLFKLFEKFFSKYENDKRIGEDKVKIRFLGKIELMPENIQRIIKRLEEKTKDYDNFKLNFAFAYGGRQELIDAIKALGESGEEITEENFEKYLYNSSEPEMIIRTGAVSRTSNFLPWQSIYSEWFFLDKMWPEFTKEDLISCIEQFEKRGRRFGK